MIFFIVTYLLRLFKKELISNWLLLVAQRDWLFGKVLTNLLSKSLSVIRANLTFITVNGNISELSSTLK